MIVSYRIIGHNVRKARLAAHLTQEELAERMHLSQLHMGRLERGERRASLDQIAQIAEVLNVSTFSLIQGSMPAFHEVLPPIDEESENLGRRIAILSEGCSPGTLSLMFKICEALAENDKFPIAAETIP